MNYTILTAEAVHVGETRGNVNQLGSSWWNCAEVGRSRGSVVQQYDTTLPLFQLLPGCRIRSADECLQQRYTYLALDFI